MTIKTILFGIVALLLLVSFGFGISSVVATFEWASKGMPIANVFPFILLMVSLLIGFVACLYVALISRRNDNKQGS